MPNWKLDTDNLSVVADGDAASTDAYDPGAYSVADVKAYVDGHPDEREAILAAEQAGKARVTLVEYLSGV